MAISILVVDDNSHIRNLLRIFLQRNRGVSVCGEAIDGFDAIEKARKLKPDVIILDLSMPRMDGLEAARALKTMMNDVSLILFTLYADSIQDSEASKAGICAVFDKDHITELVNHIDAMVPAA